MPLLFASTIVTSAVTTLAMVMSAIVASTSMPSRLLAHEVPKRVAVRTFVHPDGRVVRVLVRVPLEAMRDVDFPARGAYLDVTRADSALRDAAKLWVADAITLTANGQALPAGRIAAVRASLPSDHAFDSYRDALASTTGAPLDAAIDIPVQQVMLDVLLEFSLAALPVTASAPSAGSGETLRLAIRPQLANLGVTTSTILRYLPEQGDERVYVYDGDPGVVQLAPNWWHAASRFTVLGAGHLLGGIDHLLFLLCLVIPVRQLRPLIGIVTAFTVAHSLTLGASALGYAPDASWFPPLVELLIAASIVYMAVENALGTSVERRWLVAFGFGLLHGFGLSFALRDSLQFAGSHLVSALFAFNVGIELAQLAAIAVAVPLLNFVFARVPSERAVRVVISALVAHTAWHWMSDRFAVLREYTFTWPAMDTALAVSMIRFLMGVLIAGAAAWVLSGLIARLSSPRATRGGPNSLPGDLSAGAGGNVIALWCSVGMASLALAAFSPQTLHAQSGVRSTMTGVYTADQAVKGREVFSGNCSGCHTVASHSGLVFAQRWMGRPLSEFYDYVSRLMPKSGPGTLTEDEYVWVTAYVLKLNGMPASSRELSAEPALLKSIRIDSLRVSVNANDKKGK